MSHPDIESVHGVISSEINGVRHDFCVCCGHVRFTKLTKAPKQGITIPPLAVFVTLVVVLALGVGAMAWFAMEAQ